MLPDPREASWADLCDRTLQGWHLIEAFPTQRPASSVSRIRDGEGREYVIKQHLTRTRHDREVHAYTHWTRHLREHAAALIAADEQNLAILLQAVPGTPADGAVLDAQSQAATHHRAGALLRTLHRIPLDNLSFATAPAEVAGPRLGQRFSHWRPLAMPQLSRDDAQLLDRAAGPLDELGDIPTGVCHLDYQPHNWIIDNSAETSAGSSASPAFYVIDFEHSRVDVLVRDLVRLEIRIWSAHPELREAFFDGYGRSLDDQEKRILHACAAIDVVSCLARAQATGNDSLGRHANAALAWLRAHQDGRSHRALASSPTMIDQLRAPDPVGRDLELLRTRSYRFSDNPTHHVVAETLVDQYLNDTMPSSRSLRYVRRSLDQVRQDGSLPEIDPRLLASNELDLDIDEERRRREPFAYGRYLSGPDPDMVVAVIGAPRSGTSHLVNLLADTNRFAYFTTASCWAWPTWNLQHPKRATLNGTDRVTARAVLSVDNKRTRVIPALVMPGEAEDVYARAAPVYRHLGGHRYAITEVAEEGDLDILRGGCTAHLHHFQRPTLLTKSPFNSLRIPLLESLWPGRVKYIHILRDRAQSAESMRRNRFQFNFVSDADTAEYAWDRFVEAIRETAPQERLMTIAYEDITQEPASTLALLLSWLGQE